MPVIYIYLVDILNPITDSVSTQQILYREVTETNPTTGFSDFVFVARSYTATFNEPITALADQMVYTIPLQNRGVTSTYLTTDIQSPQWPVQAYYTNPFSTPVSAFFTGVGEEDTIVRAYFDYTYSFPASAYFTTPSTFNVPVIATLGTLSKDFTATASFVASAFTSFNARIVIQPKPTPSIPNFTGLVNFPASITIKGSSQKDILIKASFRTPPINVDTVITARFAGDTFMHITNLGTGDVHTCKVDHDGFWHVDGLLPGDYSIQPVLGGITFDPPIQYFTITDASPTLYFTEVGVYDINNPFGDS